MTPNWEWQKGPDNASTLVVRGDLDVAVGVDFVTAVDEVLSTDPSINHVVLDLSDVEFIDSSGLRALLQLQQRYGGRVQIGPVSAAVQRLLELTGTLEHFRLGEQHD